MNMRTHASRKPALPGLLLAAILLLSVTSGWATTTPILDWHSLLADPDPVELTQLARQYEQAIGYRRDYGRARQLYCAAARLGHLPAQLRLAWMYANGLGAPRDTDLAGAWLQVAADNGDQQARKFLAFIGEPAVPREPRCTYESRYDAYAIASIPQEKASPGIRLDSPGQQQIASWVRRLAPEYGLDPELVLAIILVESNFDPGALSHRNAQGLMQLIPETAARFGVRDTMDPVQNLHGGMAYLRWLLAFFEGDLRLSLAGYNAGERAVERFLGIPPYQETQNYVRKVIRAYGRDRHPEVEMVVEPSKAFTSRQQDP